MKKYSLYFIITFIIALMLTACYGNKESKIETIGPSFEESAHHRNEDSLDQSQPASQPKTSNEQGREVDTRTDNIEEASDKEDKLQENDFFDLSKAPYNVSLSDAIHTFNDSFSGYNISISGINFYQERDRMYYEIWGWDGEYHFQAKVDAHRAEVFDKQVKKDNHQLDYITWEQIIIPQDAMQFAIDDEADNKLVGWNLFSNEYGYPIYKMRFKNGPDQYIHAITGENL